MIGNINEKIYHCTKTVMIFKCEIQLKKKTTHANKNSRYN